MGLINLVLFCVVTFFSLVCASFLWAICLCVDTVLWQPSVYVATVTSVCLSLRPCWVYRYVCVTALRFLCVPQYLECSVRSSPRWVSHVCCK